MAEQLPVTCVCSAGPFIVLASENHARVFYQGHYVASTTANDQADQHKMRIRQIALSETSGVLVTVAEDKLVKTWKLSADNASTPEPCPLTLLSTRSIPKRANALKLTPDEQNIVIADKFGDVFSLPLDATLPDSAKDQKGQPVPVLGHVSMLTDLLFLQDGRHIVTCDRDEHVRISKWPQGYDIVQFLFGHTRAVACLALIQKSQTLLSAGADAFIMVWTMSTASGSSLEEPIFEQTKKIDINTHLVPYNKVSSNKRQFRGGEEKKRKKQPKAQRKGQVGAKLQKETESVPAVVPEQVTQQPPLIKKMLVLDDGKVAAIAAGNSAVALVDPETDAVSVFDLGNPILDMCPLDNERYLVSLDVSRGSFVPHLVLIKRDASTFKVEDDPLMAKLQSHGSDQVSEATPYPDSNVLFPELELLFKDPTDLDNFEGKRAAETAGSEKDDASLAKQKREERSSSVGGGESPALKKQRTD